MKKTLLVAAVLALAVGLIGYFMMQRPKPLATYPVPEGKDEAGISHPIEEAGPKVQQADGEKPLPPLRESDERMEDVLTGLFEDRPIGKFFVVDHFIRRFVATVDNLPRRELPSNRMPTRPVPGKFQVTGEGEEFVIDPANYRRYAPYVQLIEGVDPARAVAVYVRFYPLFQEAYRELGYPYGYFNDRLVEVIDHLLAIPEVPRPVRLVQPKISFQYADPELEALSAGRKIMVRMGPENAARVKALLKRYRQELTGALEIN